MSSLTLLTVSSGEQYTMRSAGVMISETGADSACLLSACITSLRSTSRPVKTPMISPVFGEHVSSDPTRRLTSSSIAKATVVSGETIAGLSR